MKHISRIKIEHYRALKSVDFRLGSMAVLIGENDVGKTSVLNALKAFYANKKLSDSNDFHLHDCDCPVTITLTFSNENDEIQIRRIFAFNKPPVTEYFDHGEFKTSPKVLVDGAINQDGFYFFPVNRDIAVQFAMTKTALLGKLVRDCVRSKIADEDSKKSLELLIDKSREAIEEPRAGLEGYLRQQMHNDALSLKFDDVNIDPVDGVSFTPGLSDDRVGALPLANRGAGTQNNLVIALFRYLAERQTTDSLIIALEEPENSLHPKAQRQLLSVLLELSTRNQVICTTHSPVFIERTQFESNVLITRKRDGRSDAKIFTSEALDEVRSELGVRPADALLKGGGNCALIVEGFTEEEAIPDCFEACGKSEFELGISVINAGGSDFEKMRNICMLLKSFDIPAVIMLDADAQGSADDLNRAKLRSLTNLEQVFVLSKGTIEDYFPKYVIRELLNEEFGADPLVQVEDLSENLEGEALLSRIRHLIHDRKCGQGLDYFKRILGLKGIKIILRDGGTIDRELRLVVEKVEEIATRT